MKRGCGGVGIDFFSWAQLQQSSNDLTLIMSCDNWALQFSSIVSNKNYPYRRMSLLLSSSHNSCMTRGHSLFLARWGSASPSPILWSWHIVKHHRSHRHLSTLHFGEVSHGSGQLCFWINSSSKALSTSRSNRRSLLKPTRTPRDRGSAMFAAEGTLSSDHPQP